MKKLDLLRKLGIIRYGKVKQKYRSGRERSYALMGEGIFNPEKELTTKKDLKEIVGKLKKKRR